MKGVGVKEKQWKKVKNGDAAAFTDLLEGEREGLYDYLLRMTGQVSRSVDTVDEVFQSLSEDTLDILDTYTELKACLYTTARKFNADIWNADTARLINVGVEGPPGPEEQASAQAMRERQSLAALDRQLRSLPGRERDAMLLHACAGFEVSEVSEILNIAETDVEARIGAGLQKLGGGGMAPPATLHALQRLPLHQQPPRSTQATVNLSMVMQGLKTKPVGLWSPFRIGLMALVLAATVFWIVSPDVVKRWVEALRGAETQTPKP